VREPVTLDPATMQPLPPMTGRGNVRELENVVNRIVLLGEASFTGGASASCRTSFRLPRKTRCHRPPVP